MPQPFQMTATTEEKKTISYSLGFFLGRIVLGLFNKTKRGLSRTGID